MLRSIAPVLALLAPPVFAADLIVGPGGSIQAAIDQAVAGDRVLVLPGLYQERIDLKGKAIEVVGVAGAADTILSGWYGEPVVKLHQGEGPGTRIRGLTLQGGWPFGDYGGGVSGLPHGGPRSTAVLEDCVIRSNRAPRGAGVAGDFLMIRCVVAENTAGTLSAGGYGGGVYGRPVMRECAVLNNDVVKGYYGGIWLDGAGPASIVDCVIAGNTCYNGGGGVAVAQGVVAAIQRCLITGNSVTAAPLAGQPVGVSGDMTISDSIIRGNSGLQVDTATVTYSNVEGGAPGLGNFDADPLFVNPSGGDYHLAAGSPCIDAGTPGKLDSDGTALDVGAFPFGSLYARRDLAVLDTPPGWGSLPADIGGVHSWRLHLGSTAAGSIYLILGSVTGTTPGTVLLGATLPLVADGWFAATLANPSSAVLVNTLGVLGPAGAADASLLLPPGFASPTTAWHAALAIDPVSFAATATSAVELRLE